SPSGARAGRSPMGARRVRRGRRRGRRCPLRHSGLGASGPRLDSALGAPLGTDGPPRHHLGGGAGVGPRVSARPAAPAAAGGAPLRPRRRVAAGAADRLGPERAARGRADERGGGDAGVAPGDGSPGDARPMGAARPRARITRVLTPTPMRTDLLTIYLNDHLAGAALAISVMKRCARSNEGTPLAATLRGIVAEVEGERRVILGVLHDLGGRLNPVKQAGAWVAEKLGRGKLNGSLVSYSDLSRLEEVEGLLLGVRGRLALLQALQLVAEETR